MDKLTSRGDDFLGQINDFVGGSIDGEEKRIRDGNPGHEFKFLLRVLEEKKRKGITIFEIRLRVRNRTNGWYSSRYLGELIIDKRNEKFSLIGRDGRCVFESTSRGDWDSDEFLRALRKGYDSDDSETDPEPTSDQNVVTD